MRNKVSLSVLLFKFHVWIQHSALTVLYQLRPYKMLYERHGILHAISIYCP